MEDFIADESQVGDSSTENQNGQEPKKTVKGENVFITPVILDIKKDNFPKLEESSHTSEESFNQEDVNKYGNLYRGDDINRMKYQYQSNWDRLGNLGMRVGANIIGGTISSFGAVPAVIQGIVDEQKGKDAEFTNSMMEFGESVKEWGRENFPNYRETPGKSWDVSDPAWWFEGAESAFSTLEFMLGGVAAAKGVSALAKLGQASKVLNKVGINAKKFEQFSSIAAGAAFQRNAENMVESMQLVKDTKNNLLEEWQNNPEAFEKLKDSDAAKELINKGKDVTPENLASYIAGKAGWQAYRINSINVVFDAIQLAPLVKGFNPSTRLGSLATSAEIKAANRSLKGLSSATKFEKAFDYFNPMISSLGRSWTEGVEEVINYLGTHEGKNLANREVGKKEEDIDWGELTESGFWGVFGGMAAEGVSKISNRKNSNIDKAVRIGEIKNRAVIIEDTAKKYKEIIDSELPDSQKKEAIKNVKAEADLALWLNAYSTGNGALLEQMMSSKEWKDNLIEKGLTNPEEADKSIAHSIHNGKIIESLYKQHANTFESLEGRPDIKNELMRDSIINDYFVKKNEERRNKLLEELQILKANDNYIKNYEGQNLETLLEYEALKVARRSVSQFITNAESSKKGKADSLLSERGKKELEKIDARINDIKSQVKSERLDTDKINPDIISKQAYAIFLDKANAFQGQKTNDFRKKETVEKRTKERDEEIINIRKKELEDLTDVVESEQDIQKLESLIKDEQDKEKIDIVNKRIDLLKAQQKKKKNVDEEFERLRKAQEAEQSKDPFEDIEEFEPQDYNEADLKYKQIIDTAIQTKNANDLRGFLGGPIAISNPADTAYARTKLYEYRKEKKDNKESQQINSQNPEVINTEFAFDEFNQGEDEVIESTGGFDVTQFEGNKPSEKQVSIEEAENANPFEFLSKGFTTDDFISIYMLPTSTGLKNFNIKNYYTIKNGNIVMKKEWENFAKVLLDPEFNVDSEVEIVWDKDSSFRKGVEGDIMNEPFKLVYKGVTIGYIPTVKTTEQMIERYKSGQYGSTQQERDGMINRLSNELPSTIALRKQLELSDKVFKTKITGKGNSTFVITGRTKEALHGIEGYGEGLYALDSKDLNDKTSLISLKDSKDRFASNGRLRHGVVYRKFKMPDGTYLPVPLSSSRLNIIQAKEVSKNIQKLLQLFNTGINTSNEEVKDLIKEINKYISVDRFQNYDKPVGFRVHPQSTKEDGTIRDARIEMVYKTLDGKKRTVVFKQYQNGNTRYTIFDDNKKVVFSTDSTKEEFEKDMTDVLRMKYHNIDFKLLNENKPFIYNGKTYSSYEKYLVEEEILKTNIGKVIDSKGNTLGHSFGFDNDFKIGIGSELIKDNDIEAKKADIERRRQEELNSKNQQLTDYLNATNELAKRGDIVSEAYDKLIDESVELSKQGKQDEANKIADLIDYIGRMYSPEDLHKDSKTPISDYLKEAKESLDRWMSSRGQHTISGKINAKYDAELEALKQQPNLELKLSDSYEVELSVDTAKTNDLSYRNNYKIYQHSISDAKTILKEILENPQNTNIKEVATFLQSNISKLKTLISFKTLEKDVPATYFAPSDTVFLSKERSFSEVYLQQIILHELLHGATLSGLLHYFSHPKTDTAKLQNAYVATDINDFTFKENTPEYVKTFFQNISKVRNEAIEKIQKKYGKPVKTLAKEDLTRFYGLETPFEFISEIMINPAFRNEIRSLEGNASVVDKIYNAIIEFLNKYLGTNFKKIDEVQKAVNLVKNFIDSTTINSDQLHTDIISGEFKTKENLGYNQQKAYDIYQKKIKGKNLSQRSIDDINTELLRLSRNANDVAWQLRNGQYGWYIAGYKNRSVISEDYYPYYDNRWTGTWNSKDSLDPVNIPDTDKFNNEFSSLEKTEVLNTFEGIIATAIIKKVVNINEELTTNDANIRELVKKELDKYYETRCPESCKVKVAQILNNFDKFYSTALTRLAKQNKSDLITEESLDDNIELQKDWDDSLEKQVSSRNGITPQIKLFIATVPELSSNEVKIVNNIPVWNTKKSSLTGMTKFVEFGKVFPYLSRNLIGAKSYAEIIDRLNSMSKVNPSFAYIAYALQKDINLMAQFDSGIAQKTPYDSYVALINNKDNNREIWITNELKKTRYDIQIADNWMANVNAKIEQFKEDKEGLKNFDIDFDTNYSILQLLGKDFKNNIDEIKQKTLELANTVGIDISTGAIETALNNARDFQDYKESFLISFSNIADSIKRGKKSDFKGWLGKLSQSEAIFRFDVVENSGLDIHGNPIYAIRNSSYISRWFDELKSVTPEGKEAKEQLLNQMASVPEMQHSSWLWDDEISQGILKYDEVEGVKIPKKDSEGRLVLNDKFLNIFSYHEFNGAKELISRLSKKYPEFADNDWKFMNLVHYLNLNDKSEERKGKSSDTALIPSIIASDSGKIGLIEIPRIKLKREDIYELAGKPMIRKDSNLYKAVFNSVAQEIKRIRQANDKLFNIDEEGNYSVKFGVDINALQQHYHYKELVYDENGKIDLKKTLIDHNEKINGKNNPNYLKPTGKALYFQNMIIKRDNKFLTLNDYISSSKIVSNTPLVQEDRNTIKEFVDEFISQQIDGAINTYSFLKDDFKRRYTNLTNSTFEGLITEMVLNHFVVNNEQFLFFNGSIAEYKSLVETNKRAKQLFTPGLYLSEEAMKIQYQNGSFSDGSTFRALTLKDVKTQSHTIDFIIKTIKDTIVKEKSYTKDDLKTFTIQGAKSESKNKLENDVYNIINPYLKINAADAQGYMSLDRWEMIQRGRGEFNKQKEDILKRIRAGEKISSEEISIILSPVKGYYYGRTYDGENNIFTSNQIKYSSLPLIPQLVGGTELQKLMDYMNEYAVDEIFFESAHKVGAKKILNTHSKDGSINEAILKNAKPNVFYNKFYKIQLDTPVHITDEENIMAVQISKLIISNINLQGKYTVNGKEMNGQNLINRYFDAWDKNIKSSATQLLKELKIEFQDNAYIVKDINVQKILLDEVNKRGLSDNYSYAIEINDKGEFRLPLFANNMATKWEQILTSLFTNRITRQKLPGGSAVLTSRLSLDKIVGESNIQWSKSKEDKTLKSFYNDEKGYHEVEVLLGAWNSSLYKEGQLINIDEVPDDLKTMIGYRIPTTSKAYMTVFKVVGFLPEEYKGIVVTPDDMIPQMGQDFDIDKWFIINKEFSKDKEGNFKLPKEKTRRARNNEIFDIYKAVLTNPEHYKEILTPSGYPHITELATEINSWYGNDDKNINVLTEEGQRTFRSRNINGKTILGIAANLNGFLAIAQVSKMSINPSLAFTFKFNLEGKTNKEIKALKERYKDDIEVKDNVATVNFKNLGFAPDGSYLNFLGELITDVSSEGVVAAADNAKDPLLAAINLTSYTYGVYHAGVSAGVPARLMGLFVRQPIIKSVNDYYFNQQSLFDDNKGRQIEVVKRYYQTILYKELKSQGKLNNLIKDAAANLNKLKEENASEDKIKKAAKILEDTKKNLKNADFTLEKRQANKIPLSSLDTNYLVRIGRNNAESILGYNPNVPSIFSEEQLEKYIRQQAEGYNKLDNESKIKYLTAQLEIIELFNTYYKVGQGIQDMARVVKTDSIGAGPTMNTSVELNRLIDKISKNERLLIEGSPAIKRIYPKHFKLKDKSTYSPLQTYLDRSNKLSLEVLGNLFINQSKAFTDVKYTITGWMKSSSLSESQLKSVDKFLSANLLSGFEDFQRINKEQLLGITQKTNYNNYTNYSGGAIGADTAWEQIGKIYGLGKQINYRPEDLANLSKEELNEIEEAYQKSVKELGRNFLSADSYVGGLVRRDYLQVKNAEAVFAISTIITPGETDKKGYLNKTNKQVVEGGTGYAVQMAINLNKPVYVYDQRREKWFKWQYNENLLGEKIGGKFIETEVPTLTKNFAGVGTREINEKGKEAIKNVYEKLNITKDYKIDYFNTSFANKLAILKNQDTSEEFQYISQFLTPKLSAEDIAKNGYHVVDFTFYKDEFTDNTLVENLNILYETGNAYEKDFVVSLINYSAIAHSLTYGLKSFSKIIPNKILEKMGISTYLRTKHSEYNNGLSGFDESTVDKFFRNNWTNSDFVPFVKTKWDFEVGTNNIKRDKDNQFITKDNTPIWDAKKFVLTFSTKQFSEVTDKVKNAPYVVIPSDTELKLYKRYIESVVNEDGKVSYENTFNGKIYYYEVSKLGKDSIIEFTDKSMFKVNELEANEEAKRALIKEDIEKINQQNNAAKTTNTSKEKQEEIANKCKYGE